MKPKLKLKANGAFATLVHECAEITKELRAHDTLAACKLSAPAFLREALRIAGITEQRLGEVEEKLSDPLRWFEARAVIRRLTAAFASVNWVAPSAEIRRYNWAMTAEALAEIVAVGSSTFEIAALAAKHAMEKYPESFGSCTDLAAHQKRLVELTLRRDELRHQIETQYTSDDLLIGEPNAQGNARVSFKLSGGAVPLGPNLGERLTNWLIANEGKS